jgi:hypothetical protein
MSSRKSDSHLAHEPHDGEVANPVGPAVALTAAEQKKCVSFTLVMITNPKRCQKD